MSKIVVAKLVRLGKDGDHFKKDMIAKEMRTNAKVDDEYLKEFNSQWKKRGQLYIIDKEATAERDRIIDGEPELTQEQKEKIEKDKQEKVARKAERDALKEEAKDLKLEYPKTITNEKLKELIEDKKK